MCKLIPSPSSVVVFGLALTQTWPLTKAAAACLLILLTTTTVVAVTAAFFYYIVVWLESIFGKLGSLFVMETTGGMLYSFAKWESKVERPFFIQPLKAPPIDNMMVVVRNQI